MEKGSIVLTLENIGILKKARVDIGGLSVIAGANDEGKSTVGKAFMALIKAENNFVDKISSEHAGQSFNRLIDLLFDNHITQKGCVKLDINKDKIYKIEIVENKCVGFDRRDKNIFSDCTFVQSPLVWDLCDFFSSIKTIQVDNEFYQRELDIKYPYVLWDLYRKFIPRPHLIREEIENIGKYIKEKIMRGYFMSEMGRYVFYKYESQSRIPIVNTATGIKGFGILQMLIQNDYMTKNSFIIFDEPENHLHPTWQVKFAEILVRLVQNHVCIMVNTHSPYLLEALHKYGKKYGINANFYLADGGEVKQLNHDNNATLEVIYEKLNDSFVIMDSIEEE